MRANPRQLPDDAVAVPDPRPEGAPERALGDFSVTPELLAHRLAEVVAGERALSGRTARPGA